MTKIAVLPLFLFLFLSFAGLANNSVTQTNTLVAVSFSSSDTNQAGFSHIAFSDSLTNKEFAKMKATAVALAVTLGVFGVHRLYLGTSPRIPITYTLTLGGGFFVLPLMDIVYILAAKHPDQLRNNHFIFMWNKKKKDSL